MAIFRALLLAAALTTSADAHEFPATIMLPEPVPSDWRVDWTLSCVMDIAEQECVAWHWSVDQKNMNALHEIMRSMHDWIWETTRMVDEGYHLEPWRNRME